MDRKYKIMISFLVFFTLITIIVPNTLSKYTDKVSNTIKITTSRPNFTFEFDSNDGVGIMDPISVTYGNSTNLTANIFTREGYKFIGWNTKSDGSGVSYTDEQDVTYASVTDGEVIKLYAQWFNKNDFNNSSPLFSYSCTRTLETFIAPQNGRYILEAWGAQGGSVTENTYGTRTMSEVEGGRGGYSYGIIDLNAGDKVYVTVGCKGQELKNANQNDTILGGFNDGGLALSDNNRNSQGSGGGATHFSINTSGELKEFENNQDDVLIVAGGGGGSYSSTDISYYSSGGYGGGLIAGDAIMYYNSQYRTYASFGRNGFIYYNGRRIPGATQTLQTDSTYYAGSFGKGADANKTYSGPDAGAGGGWYGGNRLSINSGTGGMAGSGGTGHINTTYSKYIDGKTLAGNISIPTHDGSSYMIGNTGDGYARISYINPYYNVTLYAQWKTFTWTQNKTMVTNGDVTLEVGSKITGYTANNISDWYVLGAKDGKLLISTNYSPEKVNLSGESGYTNGVSTLNTSAQSYDDNSLADSVRSINLDDINRVTGYEPTGTNMGLSYEYGNELTYFWDGTSNPYYSASNGLTGNLTLAHTQFKYPTENGWNPSSKSTTATSSNKLEIVTLKSTYSGYYASNYIGTDSLAFEMLFKDTGVQPGDEGSYWLADKYIYCDPGVVKYGVTHIRDGGVKDYFLVRSTGQTKQFSMGLRPVIAFKSEVEVDENGIIIDN